MEVKLYKKGKTRQDKKIDNARDRKTSATAAENPKYPQKNLK